MARRAGGESVPTPGRVTVISGPTFRIVWVLFWCQHSLCCTALLFEALHFFLQVFLVFAVVISVLILGNESWNFVQVHSMFQAFPQVKLKINFIKRKMLGIPSEGASNGWKQLTWTGYTSHAQGMRSGGEALCLCFFCLSKPTLFIACASLVQLWSAILITWGWIELGCRNKLLLPQWIRVTVLMLRQEVQAVTPEENILAFSSLGTVYVWIYICVYIHSLHI